MSNPYRDYKGMVYVAGTMAVGADRYGDGTVYRGERSKDSATPTIHNPWEAMFRQVEAERDAIAKDADKAYELLRWAETEMRYAAWDVRYSDQHGRADVYEAIVEFLK